MSANPDSVGNQGQFHDSIPPSRPMGTHGHRIAQPVGKEAVPEFHAKTYPPGSAPKESTFYPNPVHEVPGQALNPNMDPSLRTSALDVPGADSKEIYNETGVHSRPIQGQTSGEIHESGRKKDSTGLAKVGSTTSTRDGSVEGIMKERGMDLPEGKERKVLGKGISATEKDPATAEEIGSAGRG